MINLAWGISNEVEVNGTEYTLDLEFSNVLRWFMVLEDKEESSNFKVRSCLISLGNLSTEDIELMEYEDLEGLYAAIVKRIITERETKEVERDFAGNPIENNKYYDLFEDSGFIFASFMHQYQIDLTEINLHWDKFNAMLDGLCENTRFREVIKIRKMEIPDKATQKEKDSIIKAKKSVALKSNREAMEFEAMDLKQKREWYKRQRERGG